MFFMLFLFEIIDMGSEAERNRLWVFSIYSLNAVIIYALPLCYIAEKIDSKMAGFMVVTVLGVSILTFHWVVNNVAQFSSGLKFLESFWNFVTSPGSQSDTLIKLGTILTAVLQAFGGANTVFNALLDPLFPQNQSKPFSLRNASQEK